MSDVRLTATNPEDSTVVPVACNERGELLVTKTVVEEIDNDVTINGSFNVVSVDSAPSTYLYQFDKNTGDIEVADNSSSKTSWKILASGLGQFSNFTEAGTAKVNISGNSKPISVFTHTGPQVYYVSWSGIVSSANYYINLESEKAEHYSPVRNVETGEETKEYIGPVLDVRKELEFLRAQLRDLMEKLKMAPEGGWEVWDGESAS